MQILLTPEESEKIFHTALCNVVGSNYIQGYGLELYYEQDDYQNAKRILQDNNTERRDICYEDVLLEVLRSGKKITLIDNECEGEYNKSITLKDVHQYVQTTPIENLLNIHTEQDDVDDADAVIQTVFYQEIIFG